MKNGHLLWNLFEAVIEERIRLRQGGAFGYRFVEIFCGGGEDFVELERDILGLQRSFREFLT